MRAISNRSLARYAVNEVQSGTSWQVIAKDIAAELVASGRSKQAGRVVAEIAYELEEKGVLVPVKVTAAYPLSAATKQKIIQFITSTSTAKKVVLAVDVDPRLLSGFKIETPSRTWDMSGMSMLHALTNTGDAL